MFHHPLSLQGVYSSILYVYFHSKMQKKQYLCVHWQKIAHQAWKIAQMCLRRLHIFPTMQQTTITITEFIGNIALLPWLQFWLVLALTVTWDLQSASPVERFDIFIESDACQAGHAVRQVNLKGEQKDWIF